MDRQPTTTLHWSDGIRTGTEKIAAAAVAVALVAVTEAVAVFEEVICMIIHGDDGTWHDLSESCSPTLCRPLL